MRRGKLSKLPFPRDPSSASGTYLLARRGTPLGFVININGFRFMKSPGAQGMFFMLGCESSSPFSDASVPSLLPRARGCVRGKHPQVPTYPRGTGGTGEPCPSHAVPGAAMLHHCPVTAPRLAAGLWGPAGSGVSSGGGGRTVLARVAPVCPWVPGPGAPLLPSPLSGVRLSKAAGPCPLT